MGHRKVTWLNQVGKQAQGVGPGVVVILKGEEGNLSPLSRSGLYKDCWNHQQKVARREERLVGHVEGGIQGGKPLSFSRVSSGYVTLDAPSCHSWVCHPTSHSLGVREEEV